MFVLLFLRPWKANSLHRYSTNRPTASIDNKVGINNANSLVSADRAVVVSTAHFNRIFPRLNVLLHIIDDSSNDALDDVLKAGLIDKNVVQ
jgi:hypothetical protein